MTAEAGADFFSSKFFCLKFIFLGGWKKTFFSERKHFNAQCPAWEDLVKKLCEIFQKIRLANNCKKTILQSLCYSRLYNANKWARYKKYSKTLFLNLQWYNHEDTKSYIFDTTIHVMYEIQYLHVHM
jgi:hypothetical protein